MPEPDGDEEPSDKATEDIPAKGYYQFLKGKYPEMFAAMGRVE